MVAELKHPADEIGKALARASGILTVLSSCYDRHTQTFETGSNYAYESILAIETIVVNAASALEKLYSSYDLTPIAVDGGVEMPLETSSIASSSTTAILKDSDPLNGYFGRAAQAHKIETANLNSYLSSFGPSENAPRLVDRAEQAAGHSFTFESQQVPAPKAERRAESYDELLHKLTTVAHRAAAFEHQPGFEDKLLPALEDLRADILRMRSVA